MITIKNEVGETVTFKSLDDFEEKFLFNKSSIHEGIIDGLNFEGGEAFPLLDFAFHRSGYRLISKDGKYYDIGTGSFLGRYQSAPILTDDSRQFKHLYDIGASVIYGNDINALADVAHANQIKFKIATIADLKLGYKKHLIDIPHNATASRVRALVQSGKSDALIIESASNIAIKPIQWLWYGWLPLGKLTILAGAGGSGKTNLMLSLIAAISNGGKFPDGATSAHHGEIIIYSTEDDPSDTLIPRLIANGANLDRINFITAKEDAKGRLLPFNAAEDLPLIYEYAEGRNIALLLIDPIVSAVAKDMNKANDVRQGLQILVDFAQDYNCAVVGISHFAKGTRGALPSDRIIGSQAFTALARMTWVASKPEDSEKPCILTRAKSNISTLDGGFGYQIEPCQVGDGIETTRIVWGEYMTGTAKQLLDDAEFDEEERPTTLFDEAKAFLIDLLLENGEMIAKEIKALAKDADITPITLRRAREEVCDRPRKKSDGWYWKLKDSYTLQHNLAAGSKIEPSISNLVDYGTSP